MNAPRYVVLWVPNWELTSLVVETPPGACAAVVSRSRVQALTPAAQSRGVKIGMTQTMAQYCCPDLLIFPPDEDRASGAFEAVLKVFDTLASDVMAIRPGLAFAPARGPAKWAGSEQALAAELVEQVALQTGAECQVGIANTLSAALLAARSGIIVPAERTTFFLDSQLIGALIEDLPLKLRQTINPQLSTLSALGIDTVGQLRALGAGPLITRFGAVGQALWKIIEGTATDLPTHKRAEEEIEVHIDFDPPALTSAQAVVGIRQVANALSDRLTYQGLYSSTVRVCLERSNGSVLERTWTLLDASSSPQVSKRILWQVSSLTERVSDVETFDDYALKTIRLYAIHPTLSPDHDPLWGGGQTLRKASKAVEEVQSLLGEEAAVTPRIHGGFDPRSRVTLLTWGSDSPTLPPRSGPWEGAVSDPPILLFADPPQALLIGEKRDGTVGRVWVSKRGELNGKPTHLLLRDDHAELPSGDHLLTEVKMSWMVRGRWWHPSDVNHKPRCYLQVARVSGPDLLLIQKGPRWWVEGIYPLRPLASLNSGPEEKWQNSIFATER